MTRSEKVFFRGGPLHALTRNLRGRDVGTEWITDPGAGGRTISKYRRTSEKHGDAVVYQYEEISENE